MQKKNWLKKLPYQNNIEKAKIPFKKQVKIAILINLFVIILSAVAVFRLPDEIPLFYGLPEGEQQLLPNWAFVAPNIIAFFIMFINIILANYSKDEYLKKVIIISGFVAIFFALITTLKIFFLVGSI